MAKPETQSIAVVGPGSIGGAVGSELLGAGHDVVLCARQGFDSLEVRTPEATQRHDVPVLTDPSDARPARWVMLAVKAYQCEGAGAWLASLCGPDTVLAVLQNGVEHAERVEAYAQGATILPVVVYLPAEKLEPGVIRQTGRGQLAVPACPEGAAFQELFTGSEWISVVQAEDFASVCWQKLMTNAATGPVAALTLRKNEVMLEPDVQDLARSVMAEVAAVGRASGVEIPEDAIDRALKRIGGAANHFSSIAQDRRANRQMEWDARNAVVGRIGRRVGVPTPLNDMLATLLRACEGN